MDNWNLFEILCKYSQNKCHTKAIR